MTRADRVHSTPPTNTPIDTTRRRFLTVAAGASVASIGTLAVAAMPASSADSAACAVDPVFDLIDKHRKAHAAHIAALELKSRIEEIHGSRAARGIVERPCCEEDDAFNAFVLAAATTIPGLRAKLAYFEELEREFETEWMVLERAECAAVIWSFAASLRNIGVLSC